MLKIVLLLSFMTLAGSAWGDEALPPDDGQDDELTDEVLSDSDKAAALEYSQKELQGKFTSGFGLILGRVTPWTKTGVAFVEKFGHHICNLSLAFGSFEFSDNLQQRNYIVSGKTQTAHIASRYFPLGFGPIYVEPAVGFVQWNGEVRPRGNDDITDISASSLTSRFDLVGADLNVNFGIMWIFTNAVFLDYNFVSLSHGLLLKETYTVSTGETRKAVRKQLSGLISMSSVNLRLGYAFDF